MANFVKYTYQDSLFRLFCGDEEARLYVLEDLIGISRDKLAGCNIQSYCLSENSYLRQLYNDCCFDIDGRLIVLLEHQSTAYKNMPLRFLLYYSELLKEFYFGPEDTGKSSLHENKGEMTLHKPLFVVFYSGSREWNNDKLTFSSLFEEDPFNLKSSLEIEVKLVDINNKDYLENKENRFILAYKRYKELLSNFKGRSMSDRDVEDVYVTMLVEFPEFESMLEKHSREEVYRMLRDAFKKYTDKEEGIVEGIEIGREEGIEIGREEGIEIGHEKGFSERQRIIIEKSVSEFYKNSSNCNYESYIKSSYAFVLETDEDKKYAKSLIEKSINPHDFLKGEMAKLS